MAVHGLSVEFLVYRRQLCVPPPPPPLGGEWGRRGRSSVSAVCVAHDVLVGDGNLKEFYLPEGRINVIKQPNKEALSRAD